MPDPHADRLGEPPVRAADSTAPPPATGPAAGAPPPDGPAGTRYHTLRPHAVGGLGAVYVARDEELGREVALKGIQPRWADDPECRERFVREAEITGRLEHPGVVPVYGLLPDAAGRPVYAMRFVRGDTLHDALRRYHAGDGDM